RSPVADVIEGDHLEAVLVARRDEPPHVRVAPEPVGEHDRLTVDATRHPRRVAVDRVHTWNLCDRRAPSSTCAHLRSVRCASMTYVQSGDVNLYVEETGTG